MTKKTSTAPPLHPFLSPSNPAKFPGPTLIGLAWIMCLSQSQSLWLRGGTIRLGVRPGHPLTPRSSHLGFYFLVYTVGSEVCSPVTVTYVTDEPGLLLWWVLELLRQFQGHLPFPGGVRGALGCLGSWLNSWRCSLPLLPFPQPFSICCGPSCVSGTSN